VSVTIRTPAEVPRMDGRIEAMFISFCCSAEHKATAWRADWSGDILVVSPYHMQFNLLK